MSRYKIEFQSVPFVDLIHFYYIAYTVYGGNQQLRFIHQPVCILTKYEWSVCIYIFWSLFLLNLLTYCLTGFYKVTLKTFPTLKSTVVAHCLFIFLLYLSVIQVCCGKQENSNVCHGQKQNLILNYELHISNYRSLYLLNFT